MSDLGLKGVLPEGWCIATLNDIADWGSGGTPSRKNADYYGGTVPWVKTGDLGPRIVVDASEFITEEAVKNSSAKYFPKGSVAIAMYGATIGKTSILGIDATTNQACGVGNPIPDATTTDYLYYLLCNEKDAFIAKGKGGAQPNISQALIKEHEISLPPLAEQIVIAQTLDTLLTQVGNIKTRLDAIPKILKTFRQSVLAAAVSGKLTEEWRGDNIGCKSALLNGGSWDDLPENWQIKSYKEVVESRLGKMLDKAKNSGIPTKYLGNINVRWFSVDLEKTQEILVSEDEITELNLKVGDVLICEGGEPGRCAIWDLNQSEPIIFQKALHRARVSKELIPEWLAFNLKNDASNLFLEQFFTGTTIKHLTGRALAKYPLRIPPLEEQTEIVRRVEELFSFADQIEQQVNNAQGRVNNLTQSILAKAFRGELTTQWRVENPDLISGENSAEALLAKIQVERDALKQKAKPKKAVKKKVTSKKIAKN
jgi:type I restriction enzyme S subunit